MKAKLQCTVTIWIGLMILSLATSSWGAGRKPYGGTANIPLIGSLRTTDPIKVTTWDEWQVASQVHETLYTRDREGNIEPALAQRMPKIIAGERELLIQLRPDSTFHDGTPISSKEVIASWQRLLSQDSDSEHWWLLAPVQGALAYRLGKRTRVAGLERVNKLTIRVRLEIPVSEFLPVLTALPTAILPMKYQSANGSDLAHPAGAGPFKWNFDDQGLALHAFAGHWRGRPYLDNVQYSVFTTQRDAGLAYELDRVDLSYKLPPTKPDSYSAIKGPVNQLVFLVVNGERAKQYPEGFRKAVSQAIDRRSLTEYLVGKRGRPFDGLLVTGTEKDRALEISVESKQARAYFKGMALRRMGMPAMLEFVVRKDDPFELAAAERIQINLVDVGVSVLVVKLEAAEYRSRLDSGKFDFHMARPLSLVHSELLQLMAVTALIDEVKEVSGLLPILSGLPSDKEGASGIIRERAKALRARMNCLPLFVYGRNLYVRPDLRHFEADPSGLVDLARVWLGR